MIKFSELAETNKSLLKKIIQHPFNQQLANARLAPDKFLFYLEQDALYLADFSCALKLTANRLLEARHRDLLNGFSEGAINAERELHEKYFKQFGLHKPSHEQQPACFAYTQFLLNCASNSAPAIAITALLPCFWVYQKVGEWIYQHQAPNNPFSDWIAMYSSADFAESTEKMIDLLDYYSSKFSDESHIAKTFSRSMQLEYFFWEAAYQRLSWVDANSE